MASRTTLGDPVAHCTGRPEAASPPDRLLLIPYAVRIFSWPGKCGGRAATFLAQSDHNKRRVGTSLRNGSVLVSQTFKRRSQKWIRSAAGRRRAKTKYEWPRGLRYENYWSCNLLRLAGAVWWRWRRALVRASWI